MSSSTTSDQDFIVRHIRFHWIPFIFVIIIQSAKQPSQRKAALFYSPVDFTDASDLHQTVVKFIGESIDSTGVEDRCNKLLTIATIIFG